MHDFRCPAGSGYSMPDVYAQTLDQIEMVDAAGLDLVWFTEHHFIEDGYLPNFVPVAAAAAARTRNIRISTAVALAPFAHPLRLAEDMAILDNISGGRMELGLGLGYAPHEFRAFGIPQPQRVSRAEECVEILRLAWAGERFSFSGKRFTIDDVLVAPQPMQVGGPPLWLAITSDASVERAVRFDTHVLPLELGGSVLDDWRAATRSYDRDPNRRRVGILGSVLVTDDPERDWPPVRDAERYRLGVYRGMLTEAGNSVPVAPDDDGRPPEGFIVGDVSHCVEALTRLILEFGITDFVTWGASPGIAPAVTTPMIERFAREVVPQVKARVSAATEVPGGDG